ncbi:LacI family DNA-binding transcriptional regulator [Actinospica robiniae]|uniref:LacI family DNA-binding transcriptional regulator n=1 Tax=Actinospica robiniae TaxID=304901 RepID=UPI00040C464E|nr:LacI family DNA-binding transcriptional regulator [Actinospica robiniae]
MTADESHPSHGRKPTPSLTIYDVARTAGVSIASVSRVLNGHSTPRPETRDRVLRAVQELGFVPDGAARALSSRLKEVVSVVFRRPRAEPAADAEFDDEADSLVFMDVLNRGIEVAAQLEGFDLLLSSVDVHEHSPGGKVAKLAGKSDGIILHDRVLNPNGVIRLADRIPVVTLAGSPTRASVNIGGDNPAGMRDLARHVLGDHGYDSIAYLSGHADSPDNLARGKAVREVAEEFGVPFEDGPNWYGEYSAAGGARVVRRLIEEGGRIPRVICCANDQSALGVINELRRRGLKVPDDVAVTGFDDIAVARHVSPSLTTVRQPIERLGALAFETLYTMISGERPAERQIVLPVQVVLRSSCGCRPESAPAVGAHSVR